MNDLMICPCQCSMELLLYPIGSMHCRFAYIYYQKDQPNVGKYTIHGSSQYEDITICHAAKYAYKNKSDVYVRWSTYLTVLLAHQVWSSHSVYLFYRTHCIYFYIVRVTCIICIEGKTQKWRIVHIKWKGTVEC